MVETGKAVKIFITGATGYIGGTVLHKLLESSQTGKWDITVLTRSEATVPKFKELDVTPLIGSLEDSELLTKAASDADVVLNFAHSDHLPSIKALIKGLESGGKRRILIHTSGTGVLLDNAKGAYTSDHIYSDLDIKAIHSLPLTQVHKEVDEYIFDNSQGFESIIVAPPNIYGLGTGEFNRQSIIIPMLIKAFLKYGSAFTVGEGLNIWGNIHIEDVSDFYIFLLEKALQGKASTGLDGWYFCETDEFYMKDVIAKIGEELYKRKAIKQAEPVVLTSEEVNALFGAVGSSVIGGNSRSISERARDLGWKAKGKRETLFDSIEADVEAILNAEKSKN